MFIIRFFLVALLLLFILGVLGIMLFFHSLGNIKRQIDRMWNERQGQSSTDRNGRYGSNASSRNSSSQTVAGGNSFSRNKQIFSDSDGEYVDFEETP